jgi:hypothetical protein
VLRGAVLRRAAGSLFLVRRELCLSLPLTHTLSLSLCGPSKACASFRPYENQDVGSFGRQLQQHAAVGASNANRQEDDGGATRQRHRRARRAPACSLLWSSSLLSFLPSGTCALHVRFGFRPPRLQVRGSHATARLPGVLRVERPLPVAPGCADG